MSLITRRIPHYTQPQSAVRVDKSKLNWRFVFNGGLGTRDLLSNRFSSQPLTPVSGSQGIAQKGTGTEYLEWAAGGAWEQAGSRSITIHAIAEYSSLPSGAEAYQTLISAGYVAPSLPLYLDLRSLASVVYLDVGSYLDTNNAFGRWTVDAAVWPANTPATITAGYDAGLDKWVMYINGREVTLAGAGLNVNPNPWNATELSIGRVGTGIAGRNWLGKIYAAGIAWDTPAQANAILKTPWQIFEPRKQNIFISAAAGGTIIDLTAAGFPFTGGPPHITLQATMSSAAIAMQAQPPQITQSLTTSPAVLGFTPGPVTATQGMSLTAAVLGFIGQPVQIGVAIVLSAAALGFTALALEVTGAAASIVARLLTLLGVGS